VKVRELTKELERDGWVGVRHSGSHRHVKGATLPGLVCMTVNVSIDVAKGTLGNVVRQAGFNDRQR